MQRVLAGSLGAVRGRVGAVAPVLHRAGDAAGPLQPHRKDIAAAEPAVARFIARLQRNALVRHFWNATHALSTETWTLPCCMF
jgi:hypothetical protein